MRQLYNLIIVLVLGGLIVLAGIRLASLWQSVPPAVARVRQQQEVVRPARLDIIEVVDGICSACASPQPFIDALQKWPVEFNTIKQIDGTTEEGKRYIAQQKLERFPAVVVSGETSRTSDLEQFLTKTTTPGDGYFTYYVPAPYHEVAGDKIRGLFSATYLINSDCTNCYEVMNNTVALKNLGVNVIEDKVVAAESTEGKELIQGYKIRYLPTVILVGDLDVYPAFQNVWSQVGSQEPESTYVLRDGVKLMGTYYDLLEQRVIAPTNPSAP